MEKPVVWQRFIIVLWASCLLTIVIASFVPEHMPLARIGSSLWWNLGHMLAYTVFMFLSILLVGFRVGISTNILVVIALVLVFVSATIEMLQAFVGRTASISDLALNIFGVVAAIGIYRFMRKSKQA